MSEELPAPVTIDTEEGPADATIPTVEVADTVTETSVDTVASTPLIQNVEQTEPPTVEQRLGLIEQNQQVIWNVLQDVVGKFNILSQNQADAALDLLRKTGVIVTNTPAAPVEGGGNDGGL